MLNLTGDSNMKDDQISTGFSYLMVAGVLLLTLLASCHRSSSDVPPLSADTNPVTIAGGNDIFGQIWGIVVDSTSVYWAGLGGLVQKTDKNGGTVTDLTSPDLSRDISGLAVDTASVYWTDKAFGALYKVGINSGPVTTLATGLTSHFTPVVDSASVYWIDNGSLQKVGVNGGPVTTLATGLTVSTTSPAVDPTSVYWIDNGSVQKVGINGGTVTTLATGLTSSPVYLFSDIPYAPVVDSASVYWIENRLNSSSGMTGAIRKVSIDGGEVITLVSDPEGSISAIALDSTNVYWAETSVVKKIGIDGGNITTLASGLSVIIVSSLAVDSTSVYWTSSSHPQGRFGTWGVGKVQK
jgi:hypothetical protein